MSSRPASADLTVSPGSRSYPVLFRPGGFRGFARTLKELTGASSYALVTNTAIASHYAGHLAAWREELHPVEHLLPDGEQYKTLDRFSAILDTFLDARLDRGTVVIAFGGGVVGDTAGFAASAFLRGVRYVQVPTTLLAMVDSSVGGKTAVNHSAGKNLIGAFHQPSLVWLDTSYLRTLPRRQFVSGWAELIKYGFIGGRDMFGFVDRNLEPLRAPEEPVLAEGIERSIRIKASIVEEDEREESGRRALLNFGHTFAHTIERYFQYRDILHGEAVLWGIRCACDLARRTGHIPREHAAAYEPVLSRIPLPPLPARPDIDALYEGMFFDKKVRSGVIRMVLPSAPGSARVVPDIDDREIRRTLQAVFTAAG